MIWIEEAVVQKKLKNKNFPIIAFDLIFREIVFKFLTFTTIISVNHNGLFQVHICIRCTLQFLLCEQRNYVISRNKGVDMIKLEISRQNYSCFMIQILFVVHNVRNCFSLLVFSLLLKLHSRCENAEFLNSNFEKTMVWEFFS